MEGAGEGWKEQGKEGRSMGRRDGKGQEERSRGMAKEEAGGSHQENYKQTRCSQGYPTKNAMIGDYLIDRVLIFLKKASTFKEISFV